MKKALDTITIEGYKSFRNLKDFKLNELNVLIGANGAGKSNFIDFFELLYHIVSGDLQLTVGKAGGADSLLYNGRKTTDELHLELWFEGKVLESKNGYDATLNATQDDKLIFGSETVYFWDKKRYPQEPYKNSLGHGHNESCLDDPREQAASRSTIYVLDAIKSWRVYHFHDTSDTAKVKQLGKIDDNRFLRPDASNLAACLYLMKKKKKDHYDNIVDTIKMVAPFFDDFILEPSPLNEGRIKLEWKEKGSDAYFDGNSFSDGTLRFICLATLLMQPEVPTTILLDEPELGLHPYAITVLATLLRAASQKTQVIVSTQSVTLVNQFTPEDLIIVEREDGQSVLKRFTDQEIASWLDDYGMGDLWEKNIIGGRPK